MYFGVRLWKEKKMEKAAFSLKKINDDFVIYSTCTRWIFFLNQGTHNWFRQVSRLKFSMYKKSK